MTTKLIEALAERIAERLCAHLSSPTQLASCIEHRTKQIAAELNAVGELVEAAQAVLDHRDDSEDGTVLECCQEVEARLQAALIRV